MMHSGYNLSDLVQEAQSRWLKPPEVLFILKNYEDSQLTDKPLQKPPSGSLFLFNKRVLRFFRKDGHSWRRKKDGKTVGEAHERLKVGNAEALNCYYAHGELNPNFQRRSYWMLDPAYEHIVLVHYRDIAESRHSGGSSLHSSPGSYSTLNQSPSSYTIHVPGTASVAQEIQEPSQILSNPGSGEGSFQPDIKNDVINSSDIKGRTGEIDSSSKVKINQALKRLTQQLSLEDNCSEENGSFYNENSVSHETEDITHSQLQDDSDNLMTQLFPGDGKEHYWPLFEADFSVNRETAIWNEMLGCFENSAVAGSQDNYVAGSQDNYLFTPNDNQEIFFSTSNTNPVEEEESSQWIDLADNNTLSFQTSMLLPQEVEYSKAASYSPMDVYGMNSEHYASVFEQVQTEMPLEETSSLTVSQKQLFTIHEISPEWGYAHETTKVIIIGSFLCDPSDRAWTCMFGEIEVPIQIIRDGVLRCLAPPSLPGKVTLCLTSSNRESCSEVREYEYREYPKSVPHNNLLEDEANKSLEELLLLVRFAQMLLSDPLISKRDISVSGKDLLGIVKADEDSWAQLIETLLAGNWTSASTTEWLLQELLKDKLQQWLSSRQGGSLSKKEQNIIHMVAGIGFEWALKQILTLGVNVDFRDSDGMTALHWAARFGREKMVAALVASGASAEAVTDPTKQDPTGKTPASIAAAYGHMGIAGYLSEVSLTSHLSSLTIAETELSKNAANLEAERTINSISDISPITSEDQQSIRDSLAAVRNTAEAAARIQAAFRAHSFRKRKLKEAAAYMTNIDGNDQYDFLSNDAQCLSAASKLLFRNTRDYDAAAALSIQKKYRGWKGRRDFLAFRQKVVKIQAHVRGHQVRKYYKVICWAVGILEKVVLRWRRGGSGLRGYRNESESINGSEEKDEDIVTLFRKQKVTAIDEAVTRVLSMVASPDARHQYRRLLDRYRQAKAELGGLASEATPSTSLDMSNVETDGTY